MYAIFFPIIVIYEKEGSRWRESKKATPKKQRHSHNRITRLNTWTRDKNVPFAETEYPFEHAVAVGEYSELFQRDMGPGLIMYPSTICPFPPGLT